MIMKNSEYRISFGSPAMRELKNNRSTEFRSQSKGTYLLLDFFLDSLALLIARAGRQNAPTSVKGVSWNAHGQQQSKEVSSLEDIHNAIMNAATVVSEPWTKTALECTSMRAAPQPKALGLALDAR